MTKYIFSDKRAAGDAADFALASVLWSIDSFINNRLSPRGLAALLKGGTMPTITEGTRVRVHFAGEWLGGRVDNVGQTRPRGGRWYGVKLDEPHRFFKGIEHPKVFVYAADIEVAQ